MFVLSFVPSFVRLFVPAFLRVSFSAFWPAFTLTVHLNALYSQNVHLTEQRTSGINTIP